MSATSTTRLGIELPAFLLVSFMNDPLTAKLSGQINSVVLSPKFNTLIAKPLESSSGLTSYNTTGLGRTLRFL